ncbi:M28 family peptidase [Archangium gephyra]|uniref:M28 family peptidase n=1 Tax=Archangium gephyra TaxID=48 RepID=UPI003B7FDCA9
MSPQPLVEAKQVPPSWVRSLADVDGDGDGDLVWRHGREIRVALSTRSSFAPGTVWTPWNVHADFQLADVNNDGRADLIGRADGVGQIEVALSTGSGFLPSTPWTAWNKDASYTLADVNGDGRADLIGRLPGSSEIHVALSTGSGFVPSVAWTYWRPDAEFKLADVNNDRRADLVGRVPGSTALHAALSTGTSFNPSTVWVTWPSAADFQLADVNADGRADVVGRAAGTIPIQVALSTGSGFFSPRSWTVWSAQAEYQLGDVTGDGGADLVARTPGDIQVARSTGLAFETSAPWAVDSVPVASYVSAVSGPLLQSHIEAICANGRRMPETDANWRSLNAAANYVADQFTRMGYAVRRERVSFQGRWVGDNIIATRLGSTYPSSYIEITGHYDGGAEGARTGAKDNATGTATVLEMARVLASYPNQHSLRFIAFAGEELYVDAPGSMTHVENSLSAGENIVANLNIDTTGTGYPVAGVTYRDSRFLTLWYRGTASYELARMYGMAVRYAGIPLDVYAEDIGTECQSDERSYSVHGLVGLSSLGEWRYSLYHQTDDVPENVNIDNVRWATQANVALALFLDHAARF